MAELAERSGASGASGDTALVLAGPPRRAPNGGSEATLRSHSGVALRFPPQSKTLAARHQTADASLAVSRTGIEGLKQNTGTERQFRE